MCLPLYPPHQLSAFEHQQQRRWKTKTKENTACLGKPGELGGPSGTDIIDSHRGPSQFTSLYCHMCRREGKWGDAEVDGSVARLYGRLCSPGVAALGPERVSKDHKGPGLPGPATGRWFEPVEVNMA
ncbi:unnamed protein product [Lota lota]